MIGRVTFLIDGFNVYHSVCEAMKVQTAEKLKWLNYNSLCKSFLTDVTHLQGGSLAKIYYFTALANHCGTDVVFKHKNYIAALQSFGIKTVKGNFKEKRLKCKLCHQEYISHEEKESDVNIALQLIRSFISDECDTAILISGDTDLVSAVRAAKDLCPTKTVGVAFPFKRHNDHFKKVADFTFKISVAGYKANQLPTQIILSNNTIITKPSHW